MKYQSYDIVFQEVPDEVTLLFNISNCPNRCIGCHSPHLQEDKGEILNEEVLLDFLKTYGDSVTCICFMGGDANPEEVCKLARFVRQFNKKTAWYSGCAKIYEKAINYFDYIKIGEYNEALGGLNSSTTNQRFFKIENTIMNNITERFYRN